mmetsp:Transcript_20289/g.51923  ORF Transcript_20289/g.51923 Transcript_20289/m.51923 type:complete len:97 (-) Transcript_20289:3326-3616(-)
MSHLALQSCVKMALRSVASRVEGICKDSGLEYEGYDVSVAGSVLSVLINVKGPKGWDRDLFMAQCELALEVEVWLRERRNCRVELSVPLLFFDDLL